MASVAAEPWDFVLATNFAAGGHPIIESSCWDRGDGETIHSVAFAPFGFVVRVEFT